MQMTAKFNILATHQFNDITAFWLEEDGKVGFTIIPTLVFIDDKGRAKVDIALCRGKKEYDKRQTMKEKEDKREMDRVRKNF